MGYIGRTAIFNEIMVLMIKSGSMDFAERHFGGHGLDLTEPIFCPILYYSDANAFQCDYSSTNIMCL